MTAVALRTTLVPAPWGKVRVTEGERGVVSVQLRPSTEESLARRLEEKLGRGVALHEKAGAGAHEIAEFLTGKRREFSVPLDFALVEGFALRVLRTLVRIGFGQTTSYGALAARAGSPGAARAVGAAMRGNPLPLVVPCHRVLASDGSLGGFTGGLDIKRQLLALERRSV